MEKYQTKEKVNLMKTIRILEPHNGWGQHELFHVDEIDSDIKPIDTGLCNRLLHWELYCDMLDRSNNNEHTLVVPNWIWPEYELLDLPRTLIMDCNNILGEYYNKMAHSNLYFKTVLDVKNQKSYLSEKLTWEHIKKMYQSGNFNLSDYDHWYTESGYHTMLKISNDVLKLNVCDKNIFTNTRPISRIQLKNKEIHNTLKLNSLSKIGIHIRRGNGVDITDETINSFPKNIQDTYRKFIKKKTGDVEYAYPFFPDELYFDFIDSILEKEPDQKFYISHDLPDIFIQQYYDRYGDIITTKKDYRNLYTKRFIKDKQKLNNLINYGNVVDNLIDLFSLSHCSYLVTSSMSSWSQFAADYSPKKSINIDDIPNRLKSNKNMFINEVLSFKHKLNLI